MNSSSPPPPRISFNALLMSTENLIFLLFPPRPAASSPGDFQVLGRQAASSYQHRPVIIGGIIAMVIAVPLFILTGGSYIVLTLVAGAMIVAQTCALIPAIAWAFSRFDPSIDTPPNRFVSRRIYTSPPHPSAYSPAHQLEGAEHGHRGPRPEENDRIPQ